MQTRALILAGFAALTLAWAQSDQLTKLVSPPALTSPRTDVKPFEYMEAKVPVYRSGGRTEIITKIQKPLQPEESIKHFVHPEHLEIQLVVAEPDLGGKPIAFNWDERGRLWVAVTVDYPNNLQPQGQGHDRLVICEDTDQDGRIDRVKTFADKLSIPTSFLFAYEGVVVHAPPHTLFLRDVDSDDRADEWHTLISGWGTYDTHAGPSNLLYGLDNWIYGTVGYAGFQGRIAGEYYRFSQGIYRFQLYRDPKQPKAAPQVVRFEFLRNTNNNTWGLGLSEDGEIFASTANGNPSVHLDIPNRYYEKVLGWSPGPLPTIAESARFYPITNKIRQVDFHGSFTAASGHLLYTARTYPPVYWNRAVFVADPTGHLVATLVLERRGSGYRAKYGWNLLASDDEWCAPIAAAVGPDGNVWVIDWYSYIVQHNPTPPGFRTGRGNAYETPLRDTKHGRIYRLVQRLGKTLPYPRFHPQMPRTYLDALSHENLFWRLHAQRIITERQYTELIPDITRLIYSDKLDACQLNVGAIHALWTLHGLGHFHGDPVEKSLPQILQALRHPSPAVRKNAVLVLPASREGLDALLMSGILEDPDPAIQKALLLRISELPSGDWMIDYLSRHFGNPGWSQDRGLLHAYTIAAATHLPEWLRALTRINKPNLDAAWSAVLDRIALHAGRAQNQDTIQVLLESLEKLPPEIQVRLLDSWMRGAPTRGKFEFAPVMEKRLHNLITHLPDSSARLLMMLALRWNSDLAKSQAKAIRQRLEREVTNNRLDFELRLRAAQQLAELFEENDEVAQFLIQQITPQADPEWVEGIATALVRMSSPAILDKCIAASRHLTPGGRKALLNQILTKEAWLPQILQHLAKGTISPTELSLEQRQALLQHRNPELAALANKVLSATGVLPSPDRQKVIEHLSMATKRKGNVNAGRKIFQAHCAKCHTHQGEGNKIGPDLTGMAVHSKEHLLVEILDPSRSVEGNYRQYVVATKSGRVLSGLLVAESKTTVELLDAENKTHVIPREEIEEFQASNKSLMPEGFEQQLKLEELADLLEFLTYRQKYVPLPLERVATAVSTRGMFYRADAEQERLIFPDWLPKTFRDVPFHLVDPRGTRVPNVILLYSSQGTYPPKMPKSVTLPCNLPVNAIHLLSGVSGWGYPLGRKGSLSLIVRLHYADGQREDHLLRNGEHFADYIRRVDVPGSEFAFALGQQQIRYLVIRPMRTSHVTERIEFLKGTDDTAPIIMAVTVELAESQN